MAAQPPQIRYVTEGKSLGAPMHKGWAKTWNWLLSCVFSFSGGTGLEIKGKSTGKPVANVLIQGKDGISANCSGPGRPWVISGSGGSTEITGNEDDPPEDPDDPTSPPEPSEPINGSIVIVSADDSNVKVHTSIEDDGAGGQVKTMRIGVYYV